MIYQFTQHSNLPAGSAMPLCGMFTLYRAIKRGDNLNREQKNYIAAQLYGLFGSQSHVYKLRGFAADFSDVLPCYVVKVKHYGWREYYAPDKTSLRKVLGSHNCLNILEARA